MNREGRDLRAGSRTESTRRSVARANGSERIPETDALVINLPAAARLLGISPEHARRLAKAGKLPGAFALGRRHLVSVEGLRRYLTAVGPEPDSPA